MLHIYPIALPARPNDCDCNMVRRVQALCNSVSTGNGKNAEDTAPFGASNCSTQRSPEDLHGPCLCCHDLAAPALFSLLYCHAIVWLPRQSIQSSLTRSLFLLTLPEPYHLLSCLFLAFILASISSKEITSKISLVLVTSYFVSNTHRVPFTITTPITGVMAEPRIWCDTCKERPVQEASSSCSNR